MIDKVQKIREEVETLKLCTMDEHMKFYSEAAEAEYNALCKVEKIIDSLQEEPEPHYPSFEESQGEVILYGLNGSVGTKAEPESKVGEIIDLDKLGNKCMYAKDHYTEEDRKVLCKDCEEDCDRKKEEPSKVSSYVTSEVSEVWHDASEEPKSDKELICIGEFNNPLVLSSSSDSFKKRKINKWDHHRQDVIDSK